MKELSSMVYAFDEFMIQSDSISVHDADEKWKRRSIPRCAGKTTHEFNQLLGIIFVWNAAPLGLFSLDGKTFHFHFSDSFMRNDSIKKLEKLKLSRLPTRKSALVTELCFSAGRIK